MPKLPIPPAGYAVIALFIVGCALIPVQGPILGVSHHTYTGVLFAIAVIAGLYLTFRGTREP